MSQSTLTLKRVTSYDIVLQHPGDWSEERIRAIVDALSIELSWDARDEDTEWEIADLHLHHSPGGKGEIATLTEEDLEHLPEKDR